MKQLRNAVRRILLRRRMPPVIQSVREESLTYLEDLALYDLAAAVREADRARLAGIFIEAGCALGGSAIVIAATKEPGRPFHVYDVFGMPPPPSAGDGPEVHERYRVVAGGGSEGIGGRLYYGYVDSLFDQVVGNFRRHGIEPEEHAVRLIRGMLQDTLHGDEPVAFAHIDCDRYESVKTCLERIAPRLVPGGVMVIDDYDTWSGCRKAVDEYFAGRRGKYRFARKSRLHVVAR